MRRILSSTIPSGVDGVRQVLAGARLSAALAAALVPAILVLPACGTDAESPAGGVVRDSAGVRILEYSGTPAVESPLAFSPEPVYRYGADTAHYQFQSIVEGRLLPGGSAAIFDGGNTEIVLVEPDGASGEVLAREGRGPGDVSYVSALLALGGDSLLVQDMGNDKFMLLAAGELVRTVNVHAFDQSLDALGRDPAGRLLMISAGFRSGFPEEWLAGHMVLFDLESSAADTVAAYDWVRSQPPRGEGSRNPYPDWGYVTAAGGRFVYGRSDRAELVWHRSDGTVAQIVRWEPERTHPTDEHWKVFEEDRRPTLARINPHLAPGSPAMKAFLDRAMADFEVDPATPLPLFEPPFGDDEGRLWVGDYVVAGSEAPRYTIFAPNGEWLGVVGVPDGLRILDVSGGLVLGVVEDEMEVESVVVYRVLGR